jgi:CRP-like cAMP-binding protein
MATLLAEIKHATVVSALRRCRFFADSPKADLHQIASFTVVKCVAAGSYVFHQGAPVRGFYIVHRGAIKIHRVNLLGKEQVIHVFRAGESFGEDTLLSETGYSTDACAIEDSQVLLVQKAGFIALLKRLPDLALCMLRSMSRHLRILVGLMDDLTLKDVKTRLGNWLLQRCPNPDSLEPVRIVLPNAKRELAAELGAASETFSRTMAKLRDEKLLSVNGNIVTLLCPAKLARLVNSEFAADVRFSKSPPWNHSALRLVDHKHVPLPPATEPLARPTSLPPPTLTRATARPNHRAPELASSGP